MKSLIKKLKHKIYHFFTREIHSKLDKILMLQSELLSRENMRILNDLCGVKIVNMGGGDSTIRRI